MRKGIAVPNQGPRVSGIAEIRDGKTGGTAAPSRTSAPADKPVEEEVPADAWHVPADEKEQGARPLSPADEEAIEEETGISAGAFFGLVDEEELDGEPPSDPVLGTGAAQASLKGGSMEALIGSPAPEEEPDEERMPADYAAPKKRKRSSEQIPDFEVRCFRCYHIQRVSRFAKSTQCERCSVYISLADYEVKAPKRNTLRTRGDITITRRGGLRRCDIACHHLTVNGSLDATVDCSGDAVFRHSGTARGNLHCRKLIIEKNCEVTFPDGVKTGSAEINGKLVGDLTCSGLVKIGKNGIVEGDLAAAEVAIKDGGAVTGETKIDPDTSTELPVKMGFNPSIIG